MTASSSAWADAYESALRCYLESVDEEGLSQAYEIGRRALDDGRGILELAAVHHRSLKRVTLAPDTIDRAAEFLSEALAPFEMTHLGFRQANADLMKLNAELVDQNGRLEIAKEAAETATRELEAFSYSVSHDLRAPLRSVDGFSQALLEDYADKVDEDGRRYLNFVRSSAQEMGRLIDDLLRLSRVARAELRQQPIDLERIAERIVARLRAREPERRVEIEISLGDAGEPIGDPRLLEIALDNLLGNAWKFTSKREVAHIELGAKREAGKIVYFVRDDGAGFDMRYADRLFGAFQRLHSARDFEGTGIGLATVQRVIRRHGGRVWAESELDRGATFYFTLREDEPRQ